MDNAAALTFVPMNKYIVIEEMKHEQKIGSLFTPGNMDTPYGFAKVIAIGRCEEAQNLKPGDTVLIDRLGIINHRVGNRMVSIVKILNVISVVESA